ncbi:MAG: hypothetical protein K9H64_17495 [Bacteroidales bacterium]|nr:hypothetical protein [Bacteroidales bacterium]MCF8457755.1 hypothetical protein [Bacteroidales bacterium]
MKSNEEYLNDYFQKQNELSRKGELWRLRVTPEEFLSEIDRIRNYEIENKKSNHLNEYHIRRNVDGMIEVMLMDRVTIQEAKEQLNRHRKDSEEYFAEEVPDIKRRLKLIQTPLSFRNIVNIYKWLWYKQITIEMIPENVLTEFIKTKHYAKIISKDEEDSI